MKSFSKIDIAVIGGGVLGLWSAYYLLKKFPNLSIVVFESEKFLGEHTSGRNSEVLHAGIYYPSDSLKYLHCLHGNQLWRDYILHKKMSFLDCGKIIAATTAQEDELEKLEIRCNENQVPGIRRLSKMEIQSLREFIYIDTGLFSASTAVLNVSEALNFLKRDIEAMGGIVLLNSKARLKEFSNHHFLMEVNEDTVEASTLVNTAGLFSINFRESLGLFDFKNFYVKGNYLKLKKKINLNNLIYPVPPEDQLGLGVHLTLDTAGDQKFGPDTEKISSIDYSMDPSLIEKLAPSINRVFKNIKINNLQLGYAGIRPKIKKEESIVTDFIFNTSTQHGIGGYYEFLGIESPGLTASPSLALMLSNII